MLRSLTSWVRVTRKTKLVMMLPLLLDLQAVVVCLWLDLVAVEGPLFLHLLPAVVVMPKFHAI